MSNNKIDQMEQCFLDQDIQQFNSKVQVDKAQIEYNIIDQLPANQLRTFKRPTNLYPRTIFLDRLFSLLPTQLNQPYIEKVDQAVQGKLKLKIVNSKNLTIQQYFAKSKFKCIYNKLETYSSDKKTYLSKLKGIDELIDYNEKCFKQLQQKQTRIATQLQDQIDSDFQCGNLCRAFISKDEEKEFYLMIENDINTHGYNNWFFYRFRNKDKGNKRFSIVNMAKKSLFFNQGMLISIFSRKKFEKTSQGWYKGGDKISYSNINFLRDHHLDEFYYCLSFEYDFQYSDDQVYFAINQPYTYTRLSNFLKDLQYCASQSKNQRKELIQNKMIGTSIQIKIIGYSISNNIIPAIRYSNDRYKHKQIIFIVARQHPCETVGSFIVQNIIKQLNYEQDPIIKFLLTTFQIIIVPMANPDGVIHGNSRCNMAGLDINRQWGQDVIKQLNPQTVKIKSFLHNASNKKSIKYMIDLHGHGKKLNSFFFSCKSDQKQNMKLFSMSMKKLESRFNMYGCTYGISKDKQNTIRAKANNMGISNSYTLQTSLYGWKNQNNQIKHFNEQDYNQIAKSLLKSIFLIEAKSSQTEKYLNITRQQLLIQLQTLLDFTEKDQEINLKNNDILSQSDPQGDQLDVKQMISKCQNKGIKKKLQNLHKQKKKKSKRIMSENSVNTSVKNIKGPYPLTVEMKNKILVSNLSIYHQPKIQSQSKRISLTQKWKEKRQKIVQMKKMSQINKERIEQNNSKFNNIRSKIRTQFYHSNDKQNPVIVPVSSKTFYHKKKFYSGKMKTQFQEVDALHKTNVHHEPEKIMDNNIRKSALQLKFKELKQESLNILLTNTFSTHKITSHNKQKKNEQITLKQKSSKQMKVRSTNDSFSQSHLKKQPQSLDTYLAPYTKFKNFIHKGSINKKIQKNHNSVFYYFPIL